VKLFRHAAILASFGDVFHGADFKRLGTGACLSRGPGSRSARIRRCPRARRASDLDFVTHVLAQLCRVSGELIARAILSTQSVVSAGAVQAAFNGGLSVRVRRTRLTRTRGLGAHLTGIGGGLARSRA
jgi:hypothetical protein